MIPLYAAPIKVMKALKQYKLHLVPKINKVVPRQKVNIGSGIRYWVGWNMLDEIRHPAITFTKISSDFRLPLPNNSQTLVYSSHFLEHIPENAVLSLTSEIQRVMQKSALLVLKVPDFDLLVTEYRDNAFETIKRYKLETLSRTWGQFGVTSSFKNMTSMVFAGFWSKEYGQHFTHRKLIDSRLGYHGPARLPEEQLDSIFYNHGPKDISRLLRAHIEIDPLFYKYNHQSAWTEDELVDSFASEGFKRIALDSKLNKKLIRRIPDYSEMREISKYYYFKLHS